MNRYLQHTFCIVFLITLTHCPPCHVLKFQLQGSAQFVLIVLTVFQWGTTYACQRVLYRPKRYTEGMEIHCNTKKCFVCISNKEYRHFHAFYSSLYPGLLNSIPNQLVHWHAKQTSFPLMARKGQKYIKSCEKGWLHELNAHFEPNREMHARQWLVPKPARG